MRTVSASHTGLTPRAQTSVRRSTSFALSICSGDM